MPKTSKTIATIKKPAVKKTVAAAKTAPVKKVTKKTDGEPVVKKVEKKKTTKTGTAKKTVTEKLVKTKKTTAGTATVKKSTVKKTPSKVPVAKAKKVPAKKTIKKADSSVLNIIVDAMQEKKAQQVVSLDFADIDTAICDYFVICNADSTPQVNAIADNVEEQMFKKAKQWPIRCQGKENGFWIIMDYGDYIVHIFQTEYRKFYRLEELWADAKTVWYNEE